MQKRIMIAAIKSGSGKTMLTCGLLKALKNRSIDVSAFKCGPDYIDPMFHRKVLGVPSHNLDTFFSTEEQIKQLFLMGRTTSKSEDTFTESDEQISVIEGVMGLFDGLGGVQEEGSAYHLAQILQVPILLVLDVHGMGRTMIPVLAGMLAYDTEHLIQGVVLNRASESFYQTIAPVIESELQLKVLGFVPKMEEVSFESRHLGLKMPEEISQLQEKVQCLANQLEESLDMEQILAITHMSSEEVKADRLPNVKIIGQSPIPIAIAQDEAFNFYYQENLELLEHMGAKFIPFSPLHDKQLPESIQGILLGGGYPELFAGELEANVTMRKSIRHAIERGIPSIAECGGFMYLHDFLVTKNKEVYQMCQVVHGSCRDTGRMVRFGYVEIEEKTPCFLAERERLKAHEFHYYDSDDNGTHCLATKPVSGRKWECVHTAANHWWGYPHLYYPSNPDFAVRFLLQCKGIEMEEGNE